MCTAHFKPFILGASWLTPVSNSAPHLDGSPQSKWALPTRQVFLVIALDKMAITVSTFYKRQAQLGNNESRYANVDITTFNLENAARQAIVCSGILAPESKSKYVNQKIDKV